MDLCVLPQTGADDGAWIALAAVAAVALVLGGILMRRGVSRRAIGTGVGALALVGVLALSAGGAAPSAFADAAAGADCVRASAPVAPVPTAAPTTAPTTEPTAQPAIVVTPAAPTSVAQCAAEPIVTIPSQEGVAYAQTRDGDVLTVTASALPGYVVAEGAQTVFPLDVAATERADSPVAVPAEVGATPIDEIDGVIRLAAVDPMLIPALEAAAADGALSYELSATGRLSYPYVVRDAEGVEVASGTVSGALPSTVTYADGIYAFSYQGADVQAFFAEVQAQVDAVEAQYPEANVQVGGTFPDLGIRIATAYEPGPGCETSVTESSVLVAAPPAARTAPASVAPGGILTGPSDSQR